MYGEVYAPYTGIGGINMDSEIMPMVSGSTMPDVRPGGTGTGVNISWEYPGGISKQTPGGIGWGYAVSRRVTDHIGNNDEDIKSWLMGTFPDPRTVYPTPVFTEDEVTNEDPRITEEINRLLKAYLSELLTPGTDGDYTEFIKDENYGKCVYVNMW